jgi:hypothetical protein
MLMSLLLLILLLLWWWLGLARREGSALSECMEYGSEYVWIYGYNYRV